MLKRGTPLLLSLSLLTLSQASLALTATTTFTVTATVIGACIINSAANLAFGTYDPTSATPLNGTSNIIVTCTNPTPYTVGLNAGTSVGATVTTRAMTRTAGGTETLGYALYSDAARTANWGNTSPTWVSGTGTGVQQTLTVYGQIPAAQNVPVASYLDTITVTLTY